MKCKICGAEIINKELKEKVIFEFGSLYRFRKIIYKQEIAYCPSCKHEYIEPKFYNNKKQALKELRKTPWIERSVYE